MGVVDHEFVKAEMLWHSFCFLPFLLSFFFPLSINRRDKQARLFF